MKRYLFLKITHDSNISCSTFRCEDMLPSGIEDGRIDNILEVVSYDCKLTYESLNICLYKICISLQNTVPNIINPTYYIKKVVLGSGNTIIEADIIITIEQIDKMNKELL